MSGELDIKWKDENDPDYLLNAANLHEIHSSVNVAETPFIVANSKTEIKILAHSALKIINGSTHKVFQTGTSDVVVNINTNLDTGAIAAGMDYYVYICDEDDGTASIVISLNSTYPSGYNSENSRKIGGFHALCADVGTISGHTLSGYANKDILPASVWDLTYCPECSPEGMVWSDLAKIWVDIYLQSGTGSSTKSAYGATITDTRTWFDHLDDLAAVGKRLLHDHEFQVIANGSNEETNILGSADPVTTGGHADTASRRMISNLGCEDCCGVLYQWTLTPQARLDDGTGSSWFDVTGGKGEYFTYGTNGYGNTFLLAGGYWSHGAHCGSRCRSASSFPWAESTHGGGRGCARSRNT